MLARKPAPPAQTVAPPEAAAPAAAPWWIEILGPNANPTPEEQNELLERLRLLNTDWSNDIIARRNA